MEWLKRQFAKLSGKLPSPGRIVRSPAARTGVKYAGIALAVYFVLYLAWRFLPEAAQEPVAVVFAPLSAILGGGPDERDRTRLRVLCHTVQKSTITPTINSAGSIEPFDKAEIYTKTQGRIERIFVDQGEPVKKGQVLVQMERLPLELQLQEQLSRYNASLAQARLASEQYSQARRGIEVQWKQIERQRTAVKEAKANLDRTRATFRGQTALYRAGGLSPEQFRVARTELISTEARFLQAKKALEAAKVGFREQDIKKQGLKVPGDDQKKYKIYTDLNTAVQRSEMEARRAEAEASRATMASTRRLLNETEIKSPIDGVVASRNKSPGEEISSIGSATASSALLVLVNIDKVYASVNVREGESRILKPGLKMRFTVDVFPDAKYEGEVKLISPVVDPKTHTIAVKALVDNPDRHLKPGMFIRGRIVVGDDTELLLVPAKAVQPREKDKAWVFVVREARTFRVEVTTGGRRGENIEIKEGLEPGDIIAVEKLSLLREGLKITPDIPKPEAEAP